MECITNNELLIARTLKFRCTHLLLKMKPRYETCVICKDDLVDASPANIVYEKGLETQFRVSEGKGATVLLKCLLKMKNSN